MSSSSSTSSIAAANSVSTLNTDTTTSAEASHCGFDQTADQPNPFRVRPVRYGTPINLAPNIVPHEEAVHGDIIGMLCSVHACVENYPSHDYAPPVFFVQGKDTIDVVFYQDLPQEKVPGAAQLIAQFYMAGNLEDIACRNSLFPCPDNREFYSVYFADAILTAEANWLHGKIANYFEPWELEDVNPVLIGMEQAHDMAAAKACVEKTRIYIELFQRFLPEDRRELADWTIEMPAAEAFLPQ